MLFVISACWISILALLPNAASAADPALESLCIVTSTLDGAPPRTVLVGETFEVRLLLRSHCRQREQATVLTIAAVLEPGSTAASRHEASNALRSLFDQLSANAKDSLYVGVTIPAKRGGVFCPATNDFRAARSCLSRLSQTEGPGDEGLERAVRESVELQARWRPAPDQVESPNRVIIVAAAGAPAGSESHQDGNLFEPRACSAAEKTLRRPRHINWPLVVTVNATARPDPGSGTTSRCLRSLATSPRYYLSRAVWPWWSVQSLHRPPHIQNALIRQLNLKLDPPPRLDLSGVHAEPAMSILDDGGGGSLHLRAVYVPRAGYALTLRMSAAEPGLHDLSGALTLDWAEVDGVLGHVVRPPIGQVLVLEPRHVATATPVRQGGLR